MFDLILNQNNTIYSRYDFYYTIFDKSRLKSLAIYFSRDFLKFEKI